MDNTYNEFEDATNEIDELAIDGYFGESVKRLTVHRDMMDLSSFFSACLDDWISDTDQYGKNEVKKLIIVFLKLYAEAIQQGEQVAIDVITAFMKGFPENQETECLSSFTEFARLNTETKEIMRQMNTQKMISLGDRKKFGSSLINTYSKGIELISKILTTCVLLEQISIKENIKPLEIYSLTLWAKIEKFKKLSDGKYDIIVNSIDRDIRNADAHLNIRFVPNKNLFKYKIKKGKIIRTKGISINEFLLQKYPVVGWVVQAFIYSVSLLIIAKTSPDEYKLKSKEIFTQI